MDGLRGPAGGFRDALGGPPGRRRQGDGHLLGFKIPQHGGNDGGLARARTAGDHGHAAHHGGLHRFALRFLQLQAVLAVQTRQIGLHRLFIQRESLVQFQKLGGGSRFHEIVGAQIDRRDAGDVFQLEALIQMQGVDLAQDGAFRQVQQLFGILQQRGQRQEDVAAFQRLHHRVMQAAPDPVFRIRGQAGGARDLVRDAEAHVRQVVDQTVGIGLQDAVQRIAVALVDAGGQRKRDPQAVHIDQGGAQLAFFQRLRGHLFRTA